MSAFNRHCVQTGWFSADLFVAAAKRMLLRLLMVESLKGSLSITSYHKWKWFSHTIYPVVS